ncbi:MAG: glutamate--tRNA ligase, partial [Jiangellaceae bacterium]
MPDPVLDGVSPADVRVRFSPSPTGNPHVGLIRTALFNWAFARHYGGTFVFRIEDTDAARDSRESYETLLEVMRWLGFDWDEGPEIGGAFGPYLQSERYDTYADVAAKLLAAGRAYHCYCSQEELDERNELARSEGRTPGYDGTCRSLTPEEVAGFEDEGRKPVVRFRMPDHPITFQDLVRGEITFQTAHVPDYVLVRGNGHPLYTLVNPVDDALMEISHVLRGEDLLSSTPRQIALYDALAEIGVGNGSTPKFGHLPYVMGQGN